MKNYTWQVTSLYTVDEGTKTEYVVNAFYIIVGTETYEGVEYTASMDGGTIFTVKEGQDFIPYDDLTNAIVIGWIKEDLGADGVTSCEASVGGMIDSEITPTVAPKDTPLPPNFG